MTVMPPAPTQVRKPWRATARTFFQAFVALCVLFPVLVDQTGLNVEDFGWLAIPLGVAAVVTRIMAVPQVEDFLARFLPFLAADPDPQPILGKAILGKASKPVDDDDTDILGKA